MMPREDVTFDIQEEVEIKQKDKVYVLEKGDRIKIVTESVQVKFLSKDVHSPIESTSWYELTGEDYGTSMRFNKEVFGLTSKGSILHDDGYPITPGDNLYIAVTNSLRKANIKGKY